MFNTKSIHNGKLSLHTYVCMYKNAFSVKYCFWVW